MSGLREAIEAEFDKVEEAEEVGADLENEVIAGEEEAGEEAGALHYLYRRNRRCRPSPWWWLGRR